MAGTSPAMTGKKLPRRNRQCWSARDRLSVFLQAVDLKTDGVADFALGILDRRPGRHAAWQVRHVGRIRPFAFSIATRSASALSFKPDCLRICFHVPGARSSDGFPATVTRPGLLEMCLVLHDGCTQRVSDTNNQPSSFDHSYRPFAEPFTAKSRLMRARASSCENEACGFGSSLATAADFHQGHSIKRRLSRSCESVGCGDRRTSRPPSCSLVRQLT